MGELESRGRRVEEGAGTRDGATSLPLEVGLVWLLFSAVAAEMFVTYSRLPAGELYHVSHTGLARGAGRVLVFSNFSTALVAIAVLLVLADRSHGRLPAGAAMVGVVLCAAVVWPGVVDQANLDAKPVNAVAALGVGVALGLSALALSRQKRRVWLKRQSGDRVRVAVGTVALVLGPPWLAAELGFFLNGVPLLGWLFQTGQYRPSVSGLPPFPPAVHHAHHHGMDGLLLLLSALLLSRVVPMLRQRRLRVAVGAYLALMACYAVGNIANDFWLEQVWKRHWTNWQIPDVLRPGATLAWGVIVLGAVALYLASSWWMTRHSDTRGEGGLLLDA